MKSILLFEEARRDDSIERFYALNKYSARMCICMNKDRNLRFDARATLNIEKNAFVKSYSINTFLYKFFDDDMHLII